MTSGGISASAASPVRSCGWRRDCFAGVLTSCPPSPDGKWIAALTPGRQAFLLPVDGGAARSIERLAAGRIPIGWTDRGRSLFVRVLQGVSRLDGCVTTAAPVHVERFDLARGVTSTSRDFVPGEPAGASHIDNLSIAADGAAYAYAYAAFSSVLYVVRGVR